MRVEHRDTDSRLTAQMKLAGRIEHAYELRPSAFGGAWCSTQRVWFAAAFRLWEAHNHDPLRVPLDPELYVASQPISGPFADPWTTLAQPEAARRYRSRVKHVIRQLRSELRREVRRAERLIHRGNDIDALLSVQDGRLSALGCFIVATRAGRTDLADSFADAAAFQHRSCPLYQSASLSLVPATGCIRPKASHASMNPRYLLGLRKCCCP